ncbi:MFS transporter [Kutzneria sp. NPDC052558]|uniref:MFS transporter n=1 Tax=Kutzneria sp. NPDC052558 TaxID=3364121 RepID=UPI0037C9C35E
MSQVAQPVAGRREWLGLAVLGLPTLLLALDLSVLNNAVPRLSTVLGADSVQQLWIMDVYGFMVAGFLVTMGNLGDRIGRRRLLLIGAVAFTASSVLSAFSVNTDMLILGRALMGITGATLAPSTLALISNMFRDGRQRAFAISVWVSCFMTGAAAGPVLGGALLGWFWWGSVFLLAVPVMVVLVIAGPLLLPEYRDDNPGRLDLVSVLLSLASILPVVYGVKELARAGWQLWPTVALLAGVVAGVVFVRRQRRLATPLVDVRLFGNGTFSCALAALLLAPATQGGVMLLVSLYFQLVAGLSPLVAGLWMVPSSLAMAAGSMLAVPLTRRAHPAMVTAAGLCLAAVGYLLMATVHDGTGLPVLVVGTVVAFFGIGPASALSSNLVVGSVPPQRAGAAASLSETSNNLGIALGVALIGSLGATIYRHALTGFPSGVPVPAAQTARESIAGAVSVAGQLPQPARDDLLAPARAAFMTGLDVSAVVAAVLLVGLAVIAMTVLRRINVGQPAERQAAEQAA